MDDEIEAAPDRACSVVEQRVERAFVGHVAFEQLGHADRGGERFDPLLQRLALIGEGQRRALRRRSALAMPQAIDLSFASPMISPRLPCRSPVDIRCPSPTLCSLGSTCRRSGRLHQGQGRRAPPRPMKEDHGQKRNFRGRRSVRHSPGLAGRGRDRWNRTIRTPSRWPRSIAAGMPNVRMVLLKEIEDASLRLLHQLRQPQRAQEIEATRHGRLRSALEIAAPPDPRARAVPNARKGRRPTPTIASRSLKSRLGAWASAQSQPLASRAALMAEVAKVTAQQGTESAAPAVLGRHPDPPRRKSSSGPMARSGCMTGFAGRGRELRTAGRSSG